MMLRRSALGVFGFVFLVLMMGLIIACGGSPTPTPTAVPPTAAPTAAPAATVAAGAVPAFTGPLADSFAKVKAATSYKVNLSINGKGNFSAAGGPTPDPANPDKPITFVAMTGEVNGEDVHFTIQGALTGVLGLDPTQTFEVISSKGDAFFKGPLPMLGATEAKWYKAPPEAAQIAQPPLTPSSFLDSFGQSGLNPADFKQNGTETLDGQSCDVYAGDKTAVVNAFNKLGGATGATQADLDSIDNAQFKFWVCADGYLHQVMMQIDGHDKTDATKKGSFEILMKISDFGSNPTITPPADAQPIQLPQQPPAGAGGTTPEPGTTPVGAGATPTP